MMTKFNRKSAFAALGVMLAVVAAASVQAGSDVARTTHVTFSGPVSLPGVTLATGTYIFELTDPFNNLDVVTVRDKARSRVYYTGFTQAIVRPAGAVQPVSLGEAPAGSAPKIIAWFPESDSMGHKFVYPKDAR
jgi:hypothetical protein